MESKRLKKNPSLVISFSNDDYGERNIEDHQEALVITTKIGVNTVQKIFVDNGSSVDILDINRDLTPQVFLTLIYYVYILKLNKSRIPCWRVFLLMTKIIHNYSVDFPMRLR